MIDRGFYTNKTWDYVIVFSESLVELPFEIQTFLSDRDKEINYKPQGGILFNKGYYYQVLIEDKHTQELIKEIKSLKESLNEVEKTLNCILENS